MTFSAWYDSTIVPQLNETLKSVPAPAREALRTASRQTMAACWNAAIDSAFEALVAENHLVRNPAARHTLDGLLKVGA